MMPMVKTHHKGMIPFKDFPQEVHPERLWVIEQIGDLNAKPRLYCPIILDLGCGRHKTVPEAIGIDVEPVTDRQGSLDDLRFKPRMVAVIISRHSLEHVLDPIKALREWRRVLQEDGKVIIVLPDHGVLDTMQPVLSAGFHLHAYSMESFRNLIEATRLFTIKKLEVVLEDWSFGSVLVPITW
jgi:SAM-dependent methyltransferase